MKKTKFVLTTLAFTCAIGSAVANKLLAQRNLYQKVGSTCALINCSTVDRGVGICAITGTLYIDNICTTVYVGQAYIVANP